MISAMKAVICCLALAGVAFAARKPKPKTIKTTGTVTKVVSCYGSIRQLPQACKRDGAVASDFERLHISYIHVPSLHATYETMPYIGWAAFAHHSVPVVGHAYKIRIKGSHLKWLIGDVDPDNPTGPGIHVKWQDNTIEGVTVDPPKQAK